MLPSDFFRGNVVLSFQEDAIGIRLRDVIGVDNMMWGSDYPHSESTFPRSPKILAEILARISHSGADFCPMARPWAGEHMKRARLWVEPIGFNFGESDWGQLSRERVVGLFWPRFLVRQAVAVAVSAAWARRYSA